MINDIEKMFYSEIQTKKQIGSGAYHRTGKGVKHRMSGIKFPSDFLSNKERKKLNGEVVIYHMYDQILTRDEFEQYDIETQKKMLTHWREKYSIKEIQQNMGVASATFYRYIDNLGLPKNLRNRKKRKNTRKSEPSLLVPIVQETPQVQDTVGFQQPVRFIKKGLYLEYNGQYSAEQIGKILEKLQLLLSDESSQFDVMITISEKTE